MPYNIKDLKEIIFNVVNYLSTVYTNIDIKELNDSLLCLTLLFVLSLNIIILINIAGTKKVEVYTPVRYGCAIAGKM